MNWKLFLKIFIGVLIVLWIFNPNYQRFKQFAALPNDGTIEINCRKTADWFVFSIYELVVYKKEKGYGRRPNQQLQWVKSERYTGFLMNFFKL